LSKAPSVRDMIFKYCILECCWGPHEGNNGGFIIRWGIENFGFGTTTFAIEKDGSLKCDSETCSREFVDRVLIELAKRANLVHDTIPDHKALIEENEHGTAPVDPMDDFFGAGPGGKDV